MGEVIVRFRGRWDFLSNFYPAPVVLDGVTYPTVENAWQAAKTWNIAERELLTRCDPSYAKRAGRTLVLRKDWECVKKHIMLDLLKQKFKKESYLANCLLASGEAFLCESNTWHDNYWGACICDRCTFIPHLNTLGGLLMQVRDELREGGGSE